jgi:hypothetical protein
MMFCCTSDKTQQLLLLNKLTIGLHFCNALAASLVTTHGGKFMLTYRVLRRGDKGVFFEWVTMNTAVTLDLRWMIVMFFLLSACFQLFAIVYRPYNYCSRFEETNIDITEEEHKALVRSESIQRRRVAASIELIPVHWLRYAEYSLSASIMLVGIGLLNGIADIRELFCIFTLCAATQLFGLISERETHSSNISQKYIAHAAGWFTFLTAYGIVMSHYVADKHNIDNASKGIPWYVDVIVVSMAVLFSLFGVVQWIQTVAPTYMTRHSAEVANLLLSITAKTLLGWLVLGVALRPA